MNLIKVYDMATGDYMMEYHTMFAPQKNDKMFIGDLEVRVCNVYHIIKEEIDWLSKNELHRFTHLELEVEVVY